MQLTVNTRNTIARLARPFRAYIGALKIRWYLYQLEHERPTPPAIILAPGDDPDAAAASMQRTGAAAVADLDGNALMV